MKIIAFPIFDQISFRHQTKQTASKGDHPCTLYDKWLQKQKNTNQTIVHSATDAELSGVNSHTIPGNNDRNIRALANDQQKN